MIGSVDLWTSKQSGIHWLPYYGTSQQLVFYFFVLFLTICHSLVFLLLLFCHSGECREWKRWHQPWLVLGLRQIGFYPLYILYSSQSSVVWSPCASEGATVCKIWCVHKVGHLSHGCSYRASRHIREQLIAIVLKFQVPTVSHTQLSEKQSLQ